MNRRILIALDDSDTALDAARVARQLFGEVGTEYFAVNVLKPITAAGAADFGYSPIYPLGADEQGYDAEAASVAAASAGIDERDVLTDVGDPARGIVAVAAAHAIDVIVVGSRHRSFFARLFEPSVSHGVMERALCPVLVVPERVDKTSSGTTAGGLDAHVPSSEQSLAGRADDLPELRGHVVLSTEGERLGVITDVVYDDDADVARMIVVDPGLLRAPRFVPLKGAFEAEDGEIVVPFDMATMKASPKASDNHVLSGHEVEMIEQHYGASRGSSNS